MTILALVGGFVLLLVGGDVLVRGAVSFARRLGVSSMLIGLTVVGFGTSTPELMTSLEAAFAGSPGIAVGNVVGSNTANILLILGVAAVIRPLATDRAAFRRDGPALTLATVACIAVVLSGSLERVAGIVLVVALIAYVVYSYRTERRPPDASAVVIQAHEARAVLVAAAGLPVALPLVAAGLAMTLIGARLVVGSAIEMARSAGVSETFLGLTLVAIGTSLPELATSVVATIRRQDAVAFGNVVGSNIYNILGILGATAAVRPIPVPPAIAAVDVWVMAAATAVFLVFAVTGWRLDRREGAVFLAGYSAYVAYLAWKAPVP